MKRVMQLVSVLVFIAFIGFSVYVALENQDIRNRAVNDVEYMLVTPAELHKNGKAHMSVILDKLDPNYKYRLVFELTYRDNPDDPPGEGSKKPNDRKKTIRVHENKTHKFKFKVWDCHYIARLNVQLYYRESKKVWKAVDAPTAVGSSVADIPCPKLDTIPVEETQAPPDTPTPVPEDEDGGEQDAEATATPVPTDSPTPEPTPTQVAPTLPPDEELPPEDPEAQDIENLEEESVIEEENQQVEQELTQATATLQPTATHTPVPTNTPTSVAQNTPTHTPVQIASNTQVTPTTTQSQQTPSPTRVVSSTQTPTPTLALGPDIDCEDPPDVFTCALCGLPLSQCQEMFFTAEEEEEEGGSGFGGLVSTPTITPTSVPVIPTNTISPTPTVSDIAFTTSNTPTRTPAPTQVPQTTATPASGGSQGFGSFAGSSSGEQSAPAYTAAPTQGQNSTQPDQIASASQIDQEVEVESDEAELDTNTIHQEQSQLARSSSQNEAIFAIPDPNSDVPSSFVTPRQKYHPYRVVGIGLMATGGLITSGGVLLFILKLFGRV